MNMENKLIATRYCLDNEDEKNYPLSFFQSSDWRCGFINSKGLLETPEYFIGVDPISNDTEDIHTIANQAADNFLKLLIG